MDPLDHLRALLDGATCTVCEEPVPADRVRLLAWRDDLAFVQVDCSACHSTSLGFAVAGASPPAGPQPWGVAPVSSDDVLDMHAFLAGWQGDLGAILAARNGAGPREPGTGASRSTRRGADPSL